LPEARYIGEVGLDAGPRFYKSLDLQKTVFERVLQLCAKAGGKILTVHSIRSAKIVLDLIERNLPPSKGQTVLHWFTGTKAEARRAADLGCFFSINAQMLHGEKGRELVLSLPSELLLTETDAPFANVGNRPTRPADVAATVEALAKLKQVEPANLALGIRHNLKRLVEAADIPFKH
jgi:TatD DNase family protein